MAFCRSRKVAQQQKENFVFSIRLKDDQSFLGVIDIHDIEWDKNIASIGFWLNSKFKHQGYMTEALLTFVDALLHQWKFKILKAYVDVANISARKLCQRAHFNVVEIQYESISNPIDGSLRDQCVYQIESE